MGMAGKIDLSFSQFSQTQDKIESDCMIARGNIDAYGVQGKVSQAVNIPVSAPATSEPGGGTTVASRNAARLRASMSMPAIRVATNEENEAVARHDLNIADGQSSRGDPQGAYRTLMAAWDNECSSYRTTYLYSPPQCGDVAYRLGVMLAIGTGTAQDTLKALDKLEWAAGKNHPEANMDIVKLYDRDPGPIRDFYSSSGGSMFFMSDHLRDAVRAGAPGAKERLAQFEAEVDASNAHAATEAIRKQQAKKAAFMSLPADEKDRLCTTHCNDDEGDCIRKGNFAASMGSISRFNGFADFHTTVGLRGRCESRAKVCFSSCLTGDDID
jgi:hypothetical protein